MSEPKHPEATGLCVVCHEDAVRLDDELCPACYGEIENEIERLIEARERADALLKRIYGDAA